MNSKGLLKESKLSHLLKNCSGVCEDLKNNLEKSKSDKSMKKPTLKLINKKIQKQIKKLQNKYIQNCVENIRKWNGNLKKLCAHVKRIDTTDSKLTHVVTGGKTLIKPYNIIKSFNEFWVNIYQSVMSEAINDHIDIIDDYLPDHKGVATMTEVNWNITWEDFQASLKKAKKNIAHGASCIGTEALDTKRMETLINNPNRQIRYAT
jgi:hypothetical protein